METNVILGARIKAERESQGLKQWELAKMVGVAPSTILRYESGTFKAPKLPVIESIAKCLGVSPMWLLGKCDSKTPRSSIESTNLEQYGIFRADVRKVPMLGKVACGEPIYAPSEQGSYVLAGDIPADFCLRAQGDSMIGARIHDGDIVFIRQQPEVENGEIAAVIVDNEATLKRVYYDKKKGQIILNPENPRHSPLVYVGEQLNNIKILGKAIAFQSELK